MHNELEQIDVKFDKISDEQFAASASANPKSSPNSTKHSPHASNSSGFSLKNPVSSFRSWVTHKKSSRDDTFTPDLTNTSKAPEFSSNQATSSLESDSNKRNRANSASTINSNHQQHDNPNNASSPTNTTRAKKKSPFNMRSNNPIASLKQRTSETTNEGESTEQTAASTGPLGYLKNLVRGEKQQQ